MAQKILLADDSVTIQKVVELTFSDGNFQVQCVSNGKAAVQKIQEDRPDILLCDVIMPEINGYDVAAFVKQNPLYSAIPVILLTGTFEPFDEEKARLSGADTYITKPFDSKMLVDKVEELLRRRVAFDANTSSDSVQIFHSRTEFTLGTPSPDEVQPLQGFSQELPAGPRDGHLAAGEQEFFTSADAAFEPELPVPAAGAPPQQVALLNPPTVDFQQAFPETEQAFEPELPGAAVAAPAPQAALHDSPGVDFHQAFPEAEPVVESLLAPSELPVVDLGPGRDEAIPEAAFGGILTPGALAVETEPPSPGDAFLQPEESLPEEVVVAAPEHAETTFVSEEQVPPAPEVHLPGPVEDNPPAAPSPDFEGSVSGAEGWGQAQSLPEPAALMDVPEEIETAEMASSPDAETEAGPDPDLVTELTDQQSMVAEAQVALDSEGERALDGADSPFASQPPEPITGAFEVLPHAPPEPEGWVDAEEAPYQPEEGVETGLVDAVPPTAGELPPFSAVPQPGIALDSMEQALSDSVVPEPPVEEAVAQDTGAFPTPTEQPLEMEGPPMAAPAVAPAFPIPAPQPAIDRAEIEELVKGAVALALPGLLARSLPDAVGSAAELIYPEIARRHASEILPAIVSQMADEALPPAISRAVAEAVPAQVRQLTEELAPTMITQTIQGSAERLIESLVREMAPEILREVAWEVIPELAESLIKRRIQELESNAG